MPRLISLCFLLLIPCSALHAERPNILFIAVDDLRPELGCYGTRALTPNLDALAASGLQFDRAYCNQAVCGASRVSLMTGLYPEFTGERNYHVEGWRKRWSHVVTLNQHLGAHGYRTAGLGKIYHGTGGPGVDPDNWGEWIKIGGNSYAKPENKAVAKNRKGGKTRGASTEAGAVEDNFYSDGLRAAKASGLLYRFAKEKERSAGSGPAKPFFLAVGFTKPHLPFVAPKKYWDLYERDSFSLPPNTGFPPGYPDYARNVSAGELRNYADCPQGIPVSEFPDDYNKRLLHGYHACVSYIDAQVGRVLDALEKSGFARNTIVVFWADHGWKLGDHSSWCKHTNFECDTRVPLIVRHPGMPGARGKTKSLVELIDIFPTLCDLAGLETPGHVQGKSLVPILEDPEAAIREAAYSSYPHNRGKGLTGVVGHSIRTEKFRYTEWWEKDTDKVMRAVLTDIEEDPGEESNLLRDEGGKKTGEDFSRRLRARVLSARRNEALKK